MAGMASKTKSKEELRNSIKEVVKQLQFKEPQRVKDDGTAALQKYPYLRARPGECRTSFL